LPRVEAGPHPGATGTPDAALKELVRQHWEREVCGTRYGSDDARDRRRYFDAIDQARYQQEYMLHEFARFPEARGKRILEVGCGAGSDFMHWVRHGALAHGRDLSAAAVELVLERLALEGLLADVAQGDAEALEFPDNFFELYYSWGVLHHTPDPEAAVGEAYRVLMPGGVLKIMLYHYPSVTALLVWTLYGPLRLNFQGPRASYARHVESPGTRVFTRREALAMVSRHFPAGSVKISTHLGAGDLLLQKLSGRYQGAGWKTVQKIYPRWFVRRVLGDRLGTVMMVQAVK